MYNVQVDFWRLVRVKIEVPHMYNTQDTFRFRQMLLMHAIKFHPARIRSGAVDTDGEEGARKVPA